MMTCRFCGGERFYIAREYTATELRNVTSIEGNDGAITKIEAGGIKSDEYTSIDAVTLYCSDCYAELADLKDGDVTYL